MISKKYYALTTAFLLAALSRASGAVVTFTPELSVSGEYSDNILRTEEDETDDFITIVSPGFACDLLAKRSGLRLSYNPAYSSYTRHTENDTLRHAADFSVWADLSSETTLRFEDSFLRSEEPANAMEALETVGRGEENARPAIGGELVEQTGAGIRRGREPYMTNVARLTLTNRFGPSDFVYFDYANDILKNEDPEYEDSVHHSWSIGLTDRMSSGTGMEADVVYDMGEFDNYKSFNWNGTVQLNRAVTEHVNLFVRYSHTLMTYSGNTRNEEYRIFEPSAGFDCAFDENTELSLSTGYLIRDWKESENTTRLTIHGTLAKEWRFRHTSVTLSGTSGYDESRGVENLGLYLYHQATYSVQYTFTPRLNGIATASYRYNSYIDQDPERKDVLKTASTGLEYRPREWISLGLDYSFNLVDSTLRENDSLENRIFLEITLVSPTLRRVD